MKLRNPEKLKNEKNLYKNITVEVKSKDYAKFNPQLAEAIKNLVERKELIEKLNIEKLKEKEKRELYEKLERNNAYFAELAQEKRTEIENEFERADDSYARTAQWQNLFMAFVSTENLAVYKAVNDYENIFADLKKRKREIDKAEMYVREQRASAEKEAPGVNSENAKEALEKANKEREELNKKINETDRNLDNHTRESLNMIIRYKNFPTEIKEHKGKIEIYNKVMQEVKNDPKYPEFLSAEEIDNIIKTQDEALYQERDEIKKQSPAIKEWYETGEALFKDERFEFLDNVSEMVDELYEKGFWETIKAGGVMIQPPNHSAKKFTFDDGRKWESYLAKLTDIYYRNDPKYAEAKAAFEEHAKNGKFGRESELVESFPVYKAKVANIPLKDFSELVDKLKSEITDEINAKWIGMKDNLDEKDKKLLEPHYQKTVKLREEQKKLNEIKEERVEKDAKEVDDFVKNLGMTKEEAEKRVERDNRNGFINFINNKLNSMADAFFKTDTRGKYGITFDSEAYIKPENWLKSEIEKSKAAIEKNEKDMVVLEPKIKEAKKIKDNYNVQIEKMKEQRKKLDAKRMAIGKLAQPEKNFGNSTYKKTVQKNCSNVPKLDEKAARKDVIEAAQRMAASLLKKQDMYAKGHDNSVEFNAMIMALKVVKEWGTKNDLTKTMENPPKTIEEALDQLKNSSQEYLAAKDRQKRLFPTKLRYMRKEYANGIGGFAEGTKERLNEVSMDEKVVESWNDYFKSNAEKPILTEEPKVKEETKAKEEPKNKSEEVKKEAEVMEDEDFGLNR